MAKIADLLIKLGLDTRGVDKGVKKAGAGISKFQNISKVGIAAAGVAIAGAFAYAAKEAIAFEKTQIKLIGVLKNVKGANADVFSQFIKKAGELQDITGASDDSLLNGMRELAKVTGSYQVALDNAAGVADFAAANNMSLEQSAILLGRAYMGNTTQLQRMGIYLKEGVIGQEALNAATGRFAGASKQGMQGVSGQMNDFKNLLSDVGKMLGAYLVPEITRALKFINAKFRELRDSGAVQWMGRQLLMQTKVIIPTWIETLKGAPKAMLKGGLMKLNKEWSANAAKRMSLLDEEIKKIEDSEYKWNEYAGAIAGAGEDSDETAEKIKGLSEEAQRAQDTAVSIGDTISSTFGKAVSTMLDGTATMTEKMTELLKTGLMSIIDIISIQIKAQIAAATSTAITTGGLTSGQIAGHAAQLAIIEGLKAAVGTISLAQGGIVSSPTMAVVGDSRISPEVVAPLHKLQPMITKAVNQSQSNKMTFIINGGGGNGDEFVRRELAPALDRYFKKRGGNFYGA